MHRSTLLAVLTLGSAVAQAENGLFYIGAGITSNHVGSVGAPGIDNHFPSINSRSWHVFAGIRPIRLFAIEADYVDLGSQTRTFETPMGCDYGSCAASWKSTAKAFAGYAVGFLPIPVPGWDIYGKAGLGRYELNRSITDYGVGGVATSVRTYPDNSTVLAWGRRYPGPHRRHRSAARVRGLR